MFLLESASGSFEISGIEDAEVRMPSDEFERISGNEESTVMLQKISLGTVEAQDVLVGYTKDFERALPADFMKLYKNFQWVVPN